MRQHCVFEVAVAVCMRALRAHLQSKNRSLEGVACPGVEPACTPKVFCIPNHLALFAQGTVCS